ncbi:phosphoribosylaminoimidazolesuccinocarboxamide synthase [Bacteroidota bacterium]
MEELLTKEEIEKLVEEYSDLVNEGRGIRQLIEDGEIPRLEGCEVLKGKVSDSVFGDDLVTKDGMPIRLMFRSNRISTHDVNRGLIPFKDQVLAANHDFMLNLVEDAMGSSQFKIPELKPTSTVIASENVRIVKVENVLRMYMAKSSTSTSLYQHYLKGDREFCGHKIPEGLNVNDKLPYIMDTPSTKEANDKSVSPDYLIENGVCTKDEYAQIRNSSIMAFGMVNQFLKDRGLVFVDTKTEHGVNSKGEVVVADEVYTLDSSRFWRIGEDGNLELDEDGSPKSFSKEFARGMVKDENKQVFTDEQAKEIAVRYVEGYQYLTGKRFVPDLRSRDQRIVESVNLILDYLM